MIFPKTDGSIEFESSNCCCPPGGKRRGLHTRGFTFWFRTIRAADEVSPWHSCSMMDQQSAENADTIDEFLDAVWPAGAYLS